MYNNNYNFTDTSTEDVLSKLSWLKNTMRRTIPWVQNRPVILNPVFVNEPDVFGEEELLDEHADDEQLQSDNDYTEWNTTDQTEPYSDINVPGTSYGTNQEPSPGPSSRKRRLSYSDSAEWPHYSNRSNTSNPNNEGQSPSYTDYTPSSNTDVTNNDLMETSRTLENQNTSSPRNSRISETLPPGNSRISETPPMENSRISEIPPGNSRISETSPPETLAAQETQLSETPIIPEREPSLSKSLTMSNTSPPETPRTPVRKPCLSKSPKSPVRESRLRESSTISETSPPETSITPVRKPCLSKSPKTPIREPCLPETSTKCNTSPPETPKIPERIPCSSECPTSPVRCPCSLKTPISPVRCPCTSTTPITPVRCSCISKTPITPVNGPCVPRTSTKCNTSPPETPKIPERIPCSPECPTSPVRCPCSLKTPISPIRCSCTSTTPITPVNGPCVPRTSTMPDTSPAETPKIPERKPCSLESPISPVRCSCSLKTSMSPVRCPCTPKKPLKGPCLPGTPKIPVHGPCASKTPIIPEKNPCSPKNRMSPAPVRNPCSLETPITPMRGQCLPVTSTMPNTQPPEMKQCSPNNTSKTPVMESYLPEASTISDSPPPGTSSMYDTSPLGTSSMYDISPLDSSTISDTPPPKPPRTPLTGTIQIPGETVRIKLPEIGNVCKTPLVGIQRKLSPPKLMAEKTPLSPLEGQVTTMESPTRQKGPTEEMTKFKVMREVSLPCNGDMVVTLPKMIKNTKRLLFSLDELTDELPPNSQHRETLCKLMNKVKWFLQDLCQSSGSHDQLNLLLETYDCYRSSYYCLRDHLNGSKRQNRGKYYQKKTTPTRHECPPPLPTVNCGDVLLLCDEKPEIGKEVSKCPGVLDITKAMSRSMPKSCRTKKQKPAKLIDWLTVVKDYCCCCFPCQCSMVVTISTTGNDE